MIPVQVSYAIGVSHPLSISVFHYGTSNRDEDELLQIVQKNFDLRPGVIVKYGQSSQSCGLPLFFFFPILTVILALSSCRELGLKRPIYQSTACYGHFGREDFPWEKPKSLLF